MFLDESLWINCESKQHEEPNNERRRFNCGVETLYDNEGEYFCLM